MKAGRRSKSVLHTLTRKKKQQPRRRKTKPEWREPPRAPVTLVDSPQRLLDIFPAGSWSLYPGSGPAGSVVCLTISPAGIVTEQNILEPFHPVIQPGALLDRYPACIQPAPPARAPGITPRFRVLRAWQRRWVAPLSPGGGTLLSDLFTATGRRRKGF